MFYNFTNRSVRKKMSKKEEILKIASQAFAKYGYEGVSMDFIAKKAGITKAAIYYHFKSKHELFETILTKRITELGENLKICKFTNPKENLKCYIFTTAEIYKKYPCFAAILAHEFVNGGKNLNENLIRILSLNVFKKLVNILNKGVKKDIFEINNPFTVQLMIISSLLMNQTTESLRKKISQYIDIPVKTDIQTIAKSIYEKVLKAISKENK